MAKKKKPVRRKPPKKKVTSRRPSRKARASSRTAKKRAAPPAAKKRAAKKRAATKKAATRKTVAKKTTARKSRPAARRASAARPRRPIQLSELELSPWSRGAGPESGGQSGDTEGLTRAEVADSESVEELAEEGQAFEAGIVDAVENAPDADESEIRTREVPEDDVPKEYHED